MDASSPHATPDTAVALLSDPGQPPNRRGKHAKTRNGCLRCKSRHVRCDEQRPQCQRCVKINLPCPGYAIPQARIFGLTNDECFQSDFEKKCFNSFLNHGTRDLVASCPSTEEFWLTFVPQLGQVHTIIRHAVIAIGIMQEPLIRRDVKDALEASTQNVRAMAIQHFNSAIRGFLQSSNNLRIEAKLTCCILFHVLTIYLERVTTGAPHVNAADWYLKEHDKAIARGEILYDPVVTQQLAPMVQDRIVDASTYVDGFQSRFGDCGNAYEMFQNLLPRDLSGSTTTSVMTESIFVLTKYAIGYHLGEIGLSRMLDGLRSTLISFGILIEHLNMTNSPTRQLDQRITLHNLHYFRLHHRAAFIFANSINGQESVFDGFTSQFQDIIAAGQYLLEIDDSPPWATALGTIPPLFLTATKCRDRKIRHKALELMHQVLRVENTWSSCMATSLARKLIEIEEALQSQPDDTSRWVSLRSARFEETEQRISFAYDVQDGQGNVYSVQTTTQYTPIVLPDGSAGLGAMPNRVLRAAGYSGPTFSTPRIACHCSEPFRV